MHLKCLGFVSNYITLNFSNDSCALNAFYSFPKITVKTMFKAPDVKAIP